MSPASHAFFDERLAHRDVARMGVSGWVSFTGHALGGILTLTGTLLIPLLLSAVASMVHGCVEDGTPVALDKIEWQVPPPQSEEPLPEDEILVDLVDLAPLEVSAAALSPEPPTPSEDGSESPDFDSDWAIDPAALGVPKAPLAVLKAAEPEPDVARAMDIVTEIAALDATDIQMVAILGAVGEPNAMIDSGLSDAGTVWGGETGETGLGLTGLREGGGGTREVAGLGSVGIVGRGAGTLDRGFETIGVGTVGSVPPGVKGSGFGTLGGGRETGRLGQGAKVGGLEGRPNGTTADPAASGGAIVRPEVTMRDDATQPKPAPRGRARFGGIIASGGLESSQGAERIVRQMHTAFERCYSPALETQPDVAGRVVFDVSVATGGAVLSIESVPDTDEQRGTTFEDPAALSCMQRAVRSRLFPESDDSSLVRMTIQLQPN